MVDEHVLWQRISQMRMIPSGLKWRLRAASWIHLGLQNDYAEQLSDLHQTIGSIWGHMHGVCTKAELAKKWHYKLGSIVVEGRSLSSLTGSDVLQWECMCVSASIALTGEPRALKCDFAHVFNLLPHVVGMTEPNLRRFVH